MNDQQKIDSPYQIDKPWMRDSFSKAAVTYNEAAVLQREVADRLFSRLQYVQLKPESIIDLGSGTGYCSDLLRAAYKKTPIYALDISPAMLGFAKSRQGFFSRLQKQTKYICGDAEKLPLRDEMCDMIFSSLVLQWCYNLDQTFKELRRVIKPGGLFTFATLGPDTLKELRMSWKAVDDNAHVSAFMDMHDIGDALMRAGFADPVMAVEKITLTYSSVNALMKDLKSLGSRNALHGRRHGLTGKQKMKKMIAAYEQFRKDQVLPATYEVVFGHAWVPETGVRPSSVEKHFPIPVRSE